MIALGLVLIEFVSILVYLDLWMVHRFNKHVFEPLFYLISQKQRKVYQATYKQSLIRKSFCVSDQVDVSGTTFNTCMLLLYTFSIVSHLVASVAH